jgi:hypothetical protein
MRQSSKFLNIIPPRLSKVTPLAYTVVIVTFQALAKLIGLRVQSSEKDSYSVTEIPKEINVKTGTKDRRATHST